MSKLYSIASYNGELVPWSGLYRSFEAAVSVILTELDESGCPDANLTWRIESIVDGSESWHETYCEELETVYTITAHEV